MKHTLKITFILVSLFLLAQIVGLATVNKYIKVGKTAAGETIIEHGDTVIGEPPEVKEKSLSFIPLMIAVLIGTAMVLLLIKFRLRRFWKTWFFLSVFITLAVSFDVYVARVYAVIIALILAIAKVFKPNVFVHNFTEIFIYTGITIVILPFLNLFSGFMVLLLISIYDMYAVWKSKHMIKMAKFQTKSRVFAGLLLQYRKKAKKGMAKEKAKSAILGGGDIAFPLMFSAAVMEHLILKNSLAKNIAFAETSIISLCVSIALFLLFVKGKKDRYYPAMPFLSIGCLVGFVIIWIINII